MDSQAAPTQSNFLMELWVLGAAFISQIRTRAHSRGVRVSRSKTSQFGGCADAVGQLNGLTVTFVRSCSSSVETFFISEAKIKSRYQSGELVAALWLNSVGGIMEIRSVVENKRCELQKLPSGRLKMGDKGCKIPPSVGLFLLSVPGRSHRRLMGDNIPHLLPKHLQHLQG